LRWWKYFCCFICVTLLWALHIVIKQQFFYIYIIIIHQDKHNNNRLTDNPRKPVPELRNINPIGLYTTFVVLKFVTSTPNLSSQASHTSMVYLGAGDTEERNIKNPRTRPTLSLYLPNSGFDEALSQSLFPSHSRLSLYDRYSWSAAANCIAGMSFMSRPSPFPISSMTGSEYARLHILRLLD